MEVATSISCFIPYKLQRHALVVDREVHDEAEGAGQGHREAVAEVPQKLQHALLRWKWRPWLQLQQQQRKMRAASIHPAGHHRRNWEAW